MIRRDTADAVPRTVLDGLVCLPGFIVWRGLMPLMHRHDHFLRLRLAMAGHRQSRRG
jgi:hypothetical protein